MAKKDTPEVATVEQPTPVAPTETPKTEATRPTPKASALRRFSVVVRHSPARLKQAVVLARDENDAWDKFLLQLQEFTLNKEREKGEKGDDNKARREFDAFKREHDYARTITEVAA